MADRPTDDEIERRNRSFDAAYALLRELNDGHEPYALSVAPTAHALDRHDAKRLAPIIAACRRELEVGSAVGSGLTLARRILELCGEKP